MNNNTLELLNKRDLEKSYLILYVIPNKIYLKEASNYVNERVVYVMFGCNLYGERKYISTMLEKEVEKTSEWYNFFQDLKKRKLEHIIFGLLPDVKELRDGIKLSFPNIEIFNSSDKIIEKLKKYKTYKTKEEIFKEVKRLYLAEDEKAYELNYKNFVDKYGKYTFIMDMLEEEIKKLKGDYKYSLSVRKAVYSFNYIIELKKRLSIYSYEKTFSNKEEYIKLYVNYIHASERQKHFKNDEWSEIINDIYEAKKEMIKPYI